MNGDRLIRWAAVAAVLAVAAVAAYVSFWHAVDVVTPNGEPGTAGRLYPVVIDGLIVAASMVLLDAARHGEPAPRLAWWLLAAGIAVTFAANVTYGARFGVAGALWAAWPAAAFVGCYELLMMLVRASARRAPDAAVAEGEPQAEQLPSGVPSSAEAAAEASLRATLAAGYPMPAGTLATRFSLPRKTATELRRRVLAELTPAHEGKADINHHAAMNGSGDHA